MNVKVWERDGIIGIVAVVRQSLESWRRQPTFRPRHLCGFTRSLVTCVGDRLTPPTVKHTRKMGTSRKRTERRGQSGSLRLSHALHTQTATSRTRVGTARRAFEHASHMTRPHARQWCTLPSTYTTGGGSGRDAKRPDDEGSMRRRLELITNLLGVIEHATSPSAITNCITEDEIES